MTPLHVFVGPSRPAAPIATAGRDIVWHPPIQHGDLFALQAGAGSDVLIIDGLYQQRAPIRHKEIIWALRHGVRVSGTASLGALRAAELDRFGMRGFGTVYGWYASGRLESDADVALTHGPVEEGCVPLSIAMVSLIAAGDWLCARGLLTRSVAEELLRTCSELHFTERSRPGLRLSAAGRGLADEMDRLIAATSDDNAGDIKQLDAAAAIASLVSGEVQETKVDLGSVPSSSYEAQWRLDFTPWHDITEGSALTFARLFLADYPRRHRRYVLAVAGTAPDDSATEVAARAGLWPVEDAERRSLINRFCTEQEMRELADDDLAALVIVRSFRLRPGRLVYQRFPTELFAAYELQRLALACSKALRLNRTAHETISSYSATQLAGEVLDDTFASLWKCSDIEHAVLDRGFAGVDQFRRQARPFVVAARAMTRSRDRRPAPRGGVVSRG